MPFVDGLFTYLASVAGITALTGSGSTTRIYPLMAPQLPSETALQPTLIYSQTGRQDIDTLRETSKRRTEFEFVSLARTHSAAHGLNDALETALHFYRGAMGTYTCDVAMLQDSSDDILPDQGVYLVTSRYLITHH